MTRLSRKEIEQVLSEANQAHNQYSQSKDPVDGLNYKLSLGRLEVQLATVDLEDAVEQISSHAEVPSI